MNQPLPRYHHHTEATADKAKIELILRTIGEPTTIRITHATAGGDPRKLRGIPAIGPGVTGAIPGTIPHQPR